MPDSPDDKKRANGAGQRRPRASTAAGQARQSRAERPYNLYRSAPRSLTSRLRGESDAEAVARAEELSRQQPPRPQRSGGGGGGGVGRGGGSGAGGVGGEPGGRWSDGGGYGGAGSGGRGSGAGRAAAGGAGLFAALRRVPGLRPSRRPRFHPLRLLRYLITFCIFWVVLSVVLFFISASGDSGNLPGGSATMAALSSGGPMLFSANNILVVGLDNRPRTGYSSQEKGSNFSEANANTDTLMIWRVGGGTSRKLSVPRDTLVDIPGCGREKINAAWSCGGPKATIAAVENLTGLKINHMIVVDLGNFVKFIDDIGGVTVKTPRICSNISGGAANGGYTLNLQPGTHHLTGVEAVTLARTRENSCNIAYNDFNREKMQQQIMTGIKSQLFSLHAFVHLPWASWDAPKSIQTDMGPLTLLQLFAASEIGGSSAPQTIGGAFGHYGGADVVLPSQSDVRAKVGQLMNGG